MPKGSARPDNRGEKMVIEGMKKLRKSGLGRRKDLHPGAEGTPGGVGTFNPYPTKRQYKREERAMKEYAGGGMVRGCKSSQTSGKGFKGTY